MVDEYIFLFLWGGYFMWEILMIFSWLKIPKVNAEPYVGSLSVLVPFRNEEKSLEALVESLKLIDDNDFEVLFINDHSDDNSVLVLEKCLEDAPFSYVILNNVELGGKKAAITLGVEKSKSEIIIQTDADCFVPVQWLKSYRVYFGGEKNDFVFGGVKYETNDFWTDVLQAEFSSLILVGASMLNVSKPNMCNGANLGFRKNVFMEVQGFVGNEHLVSGDDEFLMHKIFYKNASSVCFLNDVNAVVETQPPNNVRTFVNQRVRWSSKWKHYKLSYVKWLPIFLTLVYASLLLIPWLSKDVVVTVLLCKFLLDMLLIWFANQFLNVRTNLLVFVVSFVGYPFYLLYFAAVSNKKKYTWKSRTISNG